MSTNESIYVTKSSVSCSGKPDHSLVDVAALDHNNHAEYGYLDHPLVYLEIDPVVGSVVCPYCSKKFVYKL